MFNFWTIAVKEVTLFYRRKGTTLLLLLSPLLVILFLGVLFGGGEATTHSLPVAVCNHDSGLMGQAYVGALESYDLLKVTDYSVAYGNERDCRNFLLLNIRRGSFGMGLFFARNFTDEIAAGNGQRLEFLLDNSNPSLVGFQSAYVHAITSEASSTAGMEFIKRVWQKIGEADAKLAQLQAELGPVRQALLDSKAKIASVRGELEQLTDFESSSDSVPSLLSDAERQADQMAYTAMLANNLFQQLAVNSSPAALQGIALSQQLYAESTYLKSRIASARAAAASTSGDLSLYSVFKGKALKLVDNVSANIDSVITQIDGAEAQVVEARSQASFFTEKDPRNVVNPVTLETKNLFDYSVYTQMDFMLYGILALIIVLSSLLLPAVNLVKERGSGAFTRLSLTSAGGFSQALGKMLASLLVVAVETAVVLLVAILVFHVHLQNVFMVFAFALLLSSAFISLGLIIGCFTRSQNSAILVTIALIVPLTFVSGLVVPYEMMPSVLQGVTSVLPMTFGINSMKYVSLYGVLPDFSNGLGFLELSVLMLAVESFLFFSLAVLFLQFLKPVMR